MFPRAGIGTLKMIRMVIQVISLYMKRPYCLLRVLLFNQRQRDRGGGRCLFERLVMQQKHGKMRWWLKCWRKTESPAKPTIRIQSYTRKLDRYWLWKTLKAWTCCISTLYLAGRQWMNDESTPMWHGGVESIKQRSTSKMSAAATPAHSAITSSNSSQNTEAQTDLEGIIQIRSSMSWASSRF